MYHQFLENNKPIKTINVEINWTLNTKANELLLNKEKDKPLLVVIYIEIKPDPYIWFGAFCAHKFIHIETGIQDKMLIISPIRRLKLYFLEKLSLKNNFIFLKIIGSFIDLLSIKYLSLKLFNKLYLNKIKDHKQN